MLRAWRGEGLSHSSVLIPVPDAEAAVGPWRRLHDPMAPAGVPAHITLVVPWLAAEDIGDAELARLAKVVAKTGPFEFNLRSVGWFQDLVLWLGPDPVQPFLELTQAIVDEFDTPPWAGEFDKVVPHLTVAHAAQGVALDRVAEAVGHDLPLPCAAREVAVMLGDGVRWWKRAVLPLG